jgi:RimJ/RimL family protein N-acetyltransferase
MTTEIKGLGLELRPWEEGDAATLLRGVLDPEFMRWNTPITPITDLAAARDSIRARALARARDEMVHFAVCEDGGEVAGHVGLQLINRPMRRASIGYWTLPEHRGKAVARRAAALCTRWAFEQGGLHRVELGHAVENEASCRVALSVGYLMEGTLRGAMYEAGDRGRFRDEHLHARLATDPYTDV